MSETFTGFCDRLLHQAREFEASTGAHFHLLRAHPSLAVDARETPFRFQAVISGATDRVTHALNGCDFDVPGARPLLTPRLSMAFDSDEVVRARFETSGALNRGQMIWAFGVMDADPACRVLHVDADFPYLGMVHRLEPGDAGGLQARSIGWSMVLSDLDRIARHAQQARAETALLLNPTDKLSFSSRLLTVRPQAVFLEALESRVMGDSSWRLTAAIDHLLHRAGPDTGPLARSELEYGISHLISTAQSLERRIQPSPPRAVVEMAPSPGMSL